MRPRCHGVVPSLDHPCYWRLFRDQTTILDLKLLVQDPVTEEDQVGHSTLEATKTALEIVEEETEAKNLIQDMALGVQLPEYQDRINNLGRGHQGINKVL